MTFGQRFLRAWAWMWLVFIVLLGIIALFYLIIQVPGYFLCGIMIGTFVCILEAGGFAL